MSRSRESVHGAHQLVRVPICHSEKPFDPQHSNKTDSYTATISFYQLDVYGGNTW